MAVVPPSMATYPPHLIHLLPVAVDVVHKISVYITKCYNTINVQSWWHGVEVGLKVFGDTPTLGQGC